MVVSCIERSYLRSICVYLLKVPQMHASNWEYLLTYFFPAFFAGLATGFYKTEGLTLWKIRKPTIAKPGFIKPGLSLKLIQRLKNRAQGPYS
jgi:hypothetical protein